MLFHVVTSIQDPSAILWCLQYAEIPYHCSNIEQELPHVLEAQAYIIAGDIIQQSKLATLLTTEAALGKPILGIGQGALSLVKIGLIPGLPENKLVKTIHTTLLQQQSSDSTYINLSPDYQYNAFTRNLTVKDKIQVTANTLAFKMPQGLLLEVESQGLNVLQYWHTQEIAALSNKPGNVMAILPNFKPNPYSAAILISMQQYIKAAHTPLIQPLYYWPR